MTLAGGLTSTSGCFLFLFHEHFVTLLLHYFYHDPNVICWPASIYWEAAKTQRKATHRQVPYYWQVANVIGNVLVFTIIINCIRRSIECKPDARLNSELVRQNPCGKKHSDSKSSLFIVAKFRKITLCDQKFLHPMDPRK